MNDDMWISQIDIKCAAHAKYNKNLKTDFTSRIDKGYFIAILHAVRGNLVANYLPQQRIVVPTAYPDPATVLMFSSRHAYFLSAKSAASHRKSSITSGHKWPIPQKFYTQGSDIYWRAASKFLLFNDKTIPKAYSCCGNINMLAQSHLLL